MAAMGSRAPSSGISLTNDDAAVVKGMLNRGDRQHDVAAWFGVNSGRIAEIATGQKFWWVQPEEPIALPPPGPYPCGREATSAIDALIAAKRAVAAAEVILSIYSKRAA